MKKFANEIQELLNLYKHKKFKLAEKYAKNLVNKYPKNPLIYNVLGLILTAQNKIEKAIRCYESGILVDDKFAMFYNNLGLIYKDKEQYTKAEDFYKKSISLDSKIPEPYNNLANLYRILGKENLAIENYQNSVKNDPKFFVGYYNLGIILKNIGKFDEAKSNLEKAIELNQYFYAAHRNLSNLIKYTPNNQHLKKLMEIYNNKTIKDNKIELIFALAKAHDDFSDFEKAFFFYKLGNKLQRKGINFSINEEKKEFKLIKKNFNLNLFKKNIKRGIDDNISIFILGMPRSGTTLIEQIISTHPDVCAGDELNILPNLVNKYLLKKKAFNKVKEEYIKKIGLNYINEIKKIAKDSKKITDKLPLNFKWIGLIKLILPNSKIIYCKRNNKDTTLSIFKNFFVNTDLKYAYDINEILAYHRLHDDLMSHWNKLFPNFIYEISYEKLIKDSKIEIPKLIKFCNLEWNDDCLNFHKNSRVIKTASDTQARKKIYKSSVNSWLNYRKYIKF